MDKKTSNLKLPYDAIVFDLGNVLINYTFTRTFEKWADLTEYSFDFFQKNYKFDSVLYDYEIGKLSSMEYFTYLTEVLGIEWDFSVFKLGWNNIHLGIPNGILPILEQLESKYPLYILSNTNALHASHWKSHFTQITRFFNQIFCSHEMKCHKPESKIYSKLINQIDCEPARILFFDDVPNNVIGAQNIGIDAYLVKNPSEIYQILIKKSILS
ncbi:HAD family hydrolase [Candidatus Lokiarchaeum ossiferum]|uniref:HAD family hydrolase n=1 Tax=Candidatus Lokiarchaeum ossiferum TaxID=2951803 RepID=UPI00352EDE19